MENEFVGPVNVGSDEMVSINELAKLVISISGKQLSLNNIPGPMGVRGRNSDNRLIKEKLKWAPSSMLAVGMEQTYKWVEAQVQKK